MPPSVDEILLRGVDGFNKQFLCCDCSFRLLPCSKKISGSDKLGAAFDFA